MQSGLAGQPQKQAFRVFDLGRPRRIPNHSDRPTTLPGVLDDNGTGAIVSRFCLSYPPARSIAPPDSPLAVPVA